MSEVIMPAIEAENEAMDSKESESYELAFHVLPTVAEGEVNEVVQSIKGAIAKAGGEVISEEAPERFELAYEVEKHLEGKNRKFHSAYFGWIRFKAEPAAAALIGEDIGANNNILRQLLIRLTRVEEENPFNFHEAIRDQKMVTTVEDSEIVPDFTKVGEGQGEETKEEGGEVDEVALEKALEKEDV